MSETNPSGSAGKASGTSSEGQDQQTVAYESYAKLLSEKKKLQESNSVDKAKLVEYEQAKLEAEGKLKEALDNQKKQTIEAKDQFKNLFETVSTKVLKQQFYREAEKLGCVDAELAYLATSFDGVEFTKDLEFDHSVLANKLQDLAKAKPMLFKKDVKMPNDLTPTGSIVPQNQKAISDLSSSEQLAMLNQVINSGQQTT